jgi:toxin ParE1/3/4
MKYSVRLVESAEFDILELHRFVEFNDGPGRADNLLAQIEMTIATLDHLPERGHFPPELARLGIRDFREIHHQPYRIIYNVEKQEVVVQAVLDGRRDLRDLLEARLLR